MNVVHSSTYPQATSILALAPDYVPMYMFL
jgi:hypothetical protein